SDVCSSDLQPAHRARPQTPFSAATRTRTAGRKTRFWPSQWGPRQYRQVSNISQDTDRSASYCHRDPISDLGTPGTHRPYRGVGTHQRPPHRTTHAVFSCAFGCAVEGNPARGTTITRLDISRH